MEEIIKNKTRNRNVERFAIDELIRKMRGFVDSSTIKDRINKNLYKGLYLVSSEELSRIESNKSVKGIYNSDLGIILIDKDWFNSVNDVAVHEITHAYLNSENKVTISINDKKIRYGAGLEEGVVSIIQKASSVGNIDECIVDSYPYQAHLIKQLNVLYQYNNSKKYKNLLEHLLNEPSSFLPVIFQIYNDILVDALIDKQEAIDLSYRCAGAMVSATDLMLDNLDIDEHYIYTIFSNMNAIFLSLADKEIRDEKKKHSLFPIVNKSYKTAEEKLLSTIFNIDIIEGYFIRQKNMLNTLLSMYICEADKVDNNTINYGISKIKMK